MANSYLDQSTALGFLETNLSLDRSSFWVLVPLPIVTVLPRVLFKPVISANNPEDNFAY
jgi:hypothetical protein